MKPLFILLALSVQIFVPQLKGQSELVKPLPKNTYMLEMSFSERLQWDPHADYYLKAGKDYYRAVLQMVEEGRLKLFNDPVLSEESDLALLRKQYMDNYQEEYADFLDGGDDPADSFSETVILNWASGTAGVVEEFRIKGDQLQRKRISGYFAWGNLDFGQDKVKVYFDCQVEGFPWQKLEIERLAGGFSDADEQYIIDHYLYGFYPELVVLPKSKQWQRLVYDPLPGWTPISLMAEWEKKLGRSCPGALYDDTDKARLRFKSPYTVLVPVTPIGENSVNGFIPKPNSNSENDAFFAEFIHDLTLLALNEEISVYWPYDPESSLNFLGAHEDALAEVENRVLDFDEDEWAFVDPSPEELQKEIEAVDLELYKRMIKVVGHLENRDGEIVWAPQSLILILSQEEGSLNAVEVGMILMEDIDSRFKGRGIGEFLKSDACYKYPASVLDQKFHSPKEGFYVNWFLMNDWDNIPHRNEVNVLIESGQLGIELEKLYGK